MLIALTITRGYIKKSIILTVINGFIYLKYVGINMPNYVTTTWITIGLLIIAFSILIFQIEKKRKAQII